MRNERHGSEIDPRSNSPFRTQGEPRSYLSAAVLSRRDLGTRASRKAPRMRRSFCRHVSPSAGDNSSLRTVPSLDVASAWPTSSNRSRTARRVVRGRSARERTPDVVPRCAAESSRDRRRRAHRSLRMSSSTLALLPSPRACRSRSQGATSNNTAATSTRSRRQRRSMTPCMNCENDRVVARVGCQHAWHVD